MSRIKIDEYETIKYVLILPLMYVSISVMAQDSTFLDREKKARADSVIKIEKKTSDNLYVLKSKKNETKGKASGSAKSRTQCKRRCEAIENSLPFRT